VRAAKSTRPTTARKRRVTACWPASMSARKPNGNGGPTGRRSILWPSPRRRPLAGAALRLWSLSLPAPPLRPRQRKFSPNPPPKAINPTKSGCHESWRNDLIPPVSSFIGAIRSQADRPSQST
jgi:hypothetical protein